MTVQAVNIGICITLDIGLTLDFFVGIYIYTTYLKVVYIIYTCTPLHVI